MAMAVLYLGIIAGQDDGFSFWPVFWFLTMSTGGLAAWFADRAKFDTGRRMAIAAMVAFLLIGLLSILTIGVVFLAAAILALLGFAGVRPSDEEA